LRVISPKALKSWKVLTWPGGAVPAPIASGAGVRVSTSWPSAS